MPYRKDEFFAGGYYHVFNRGVNRGKIFYSGDNYRYFLKVVEKYIKKFRISVIAYCLMPNHYHFLLRQESDVTVSVFIQGVFNAYVPAINKERKRRGPLFEGRFKHILLEKEDYLLHLCRYVHLNPVKAGMVGNPYNWIYSNYREWIGKRNGLLVDREFIWTYFQEKDEYEAFVMEEERDQGMAVKLEPYLLE